MATALLVLCPALLGLVGFVLIWKGIRAGRRGHHPHCPKCDYNLTGIDSERCPECGGLIETGTIVIGERYRRPGLAAAGLPCVLLSIAVLGLWAYPRLQKVNWYPYYPASWVMADLKSGSFTIARRAWSELMRRDKAGHLSTSQRSKLIGVCLGLRAGGGAKFPIVFQFRNFLLECYRNETMTEAQRSAFLGQIVRAKLRVRPKVVSGQDIVFVLHSYLSEVYDLHNALPFWYRYEKPKLLLDGEPVDFGNVRPTVGTRPMCHSNRRYRLRNASIRPGTHELCVAVKLRVFCSTGGTEDASEPCHEQDLVLKAGFSVLPVDGPSDVTVVDDASLEDTLRECFEIRSRHHAPDRNDPRARCEISIRARRLPIGVAFRYAIRVKGVTADEGTFCAPAREFKSITRWIWKDMAAPPKSVDVILKSSIAAARDTVDILEMWNGDLVFEDVPVEVDEPARVPD